MRSDETPQPAKIKRARPRPAALTENRAAHPPRILLLYGSTRANSVSRALAQAAAAALSERGAEVAIFEPGSLPLMGREDVRHAKVRELDHLIAWAEGHVWCAPEHHGTMSAVMKLILDCFPPAVSGRSAAAGKPVCLMQVSGGALSGSALVDMQRAARALGLYTATRQFCLTGAADDARAHELLLRPDLQKRLHEALDETVKLTHILRDHADWLAATEPLS